MTSIGLNHWYGDPKRAALLAWTQLADDLGRLRDEFQRDSFYKAEVVVDDLLQIYLGSRSAAVVSHKEDIDGLLRLVQPVIESGFARTAGLLCNLEDHTHALEQEAATAAGDREREVTEKLAAAQAVLRGAKAQALAGAGPGKAIGARRPSRCRNPSTNSSCPDPRQRPNLPRKCRPRPWLNSLKRSATRPSAGTAST